MNCVEINFLLDAHAPEELTPREKQTVELHFTSCQTCRDAWAAYRELAAERPPKTPWYLAARIGTALAARAPAEMRWARRSFVLGGVLAVGAAVAAGIALRVADRAPELARRIDEPAPSVAPGLPAAPAAEAVVGAPLAGSRVDDAVIDGAAPPSGAANRGGPALDSHSLVVVVVPDPAADPRAITELAKCREQVLQQLRAVDGLNVIADERVTAFDAYNLPPEQIARELGAGTALVLKIAEHQPSCSATQLDAQTREARASFLVFLGPEGQPDGWKSFAASVAEDVRERTLKDPSTVIGEAHATVLNTALSDAERAAALRKLRGGSSARFADNVFVDDAIVAAAAELGMKSRDARARELAWVGLRGIDDPYLTQPLLHALANDPDENVRRAAAFDLAYFVDEPGVRDALARAAAEDPSDRAARCCIPSVREAARRSLLSEQDLRDLALETVLNDTLTDRERLQPLVGSPDGRGLSVRLTDEAARAVFELGHRSRDAVFRSQAWYALRRASPNPEFAQALLDDLAGHPEANVRGAAAAVLAQYTDDPAVRQGLERAMGEDSSQDVRQSARTALEGITR